MQGSDKVGMYALDPTICFRMARISPLISFSGLAGLGKTCVKIVRLISILRTYMAPSSPISGWVMCMSNSHLSSTTLVSAERTTSTSLLIFLFISHASQVSRLAFSKVIRINMR